MGFWRSNDDVEVGDSHGGSNSLGGQDHVGKWRKVCSSCSDGVSQGDCDMKKQLGLIGNGGGDLQV